MRTAVYAKSECSQFVICYLWLDFCEKSKIKRQQFCLLFSGNNQFENDTVGAFGPTGAQTIHIYKLTEFIMVDKYQNVVIAVFQIMTPGFESFNNGQKLTIVSFIPHFN